MIRAKDIIPLTEFQRNAATLLKRLEKGGRPMVLTVNGRARAVLRSADAWDQMSEAEELAELEASINEALKEADAGRVRPAAEVFAEIRARRSGAKAKRGRKSA